MAPRLVSTARWRSASPAALAFAAALASAIVLAPMREARADDVSPDGKGIVGGALLGAEVVTITESIAGVRAGWAYGVGALVGAGGGGVGGFFVEKDSSDGKAPMYMLAGGLALVIPAVVLTLNATRYMPEEGATEDRAPTGPMTPAAEPGVPGAGVVGPSPSGPPPATSAPAPTTPPTPPPTTPPPQSLLDVHDGAFRVGVPVPDVLPVYGTADRRRFGIASSETELRMPVLHVVF